LLFLDRFSKKIKISYLTKIRSVAAGLFHAEGQTEHDEDNGRFSQFVNVLKNGNLMRTNHYEARRTLRALHEIHKVKGKSVPVQAWSVPEGSRKLRFPDFMTTAQGGGKFVSHTQRPHLPPGNSPGTHFC